MIVGRFYSRLCLVHDRLPFLQLLMGRRRSLVVFTAVCASFVPLERAAALSTSVCAFRTSEESEEQAWLAEERERVLDACIVAAMRALSISPCH